MHKDTSRQTNADRAVATYRAMQRYLYVADGMSLYREAYPSEGNPYSFLWPFSRALMGTLSLAGVLSDVEYGSAVKDRFVGLTTYWDGKASPPGYDSYVRPPLGNGGDKYYDDNAWVAHALVEQFRLGLATSLDRAAELFDFARSGWDRQSGGVYWVQQGTGEGRTNHDRGAGLTAGYARLGFHLYELTGASAYSTDATRMVDWVHANLDSGTGLYWNVLRRDGSIDTNLWTYVQGEMLAARALQYRLTRDIRFLQQAEAIARATLARFGTFTAQPPSFNAMYFQSLLVLSTLNTDTSVLETIQKYADWAWNPATGARDPATNLFHFTSAGSPARPSAQPAHLQDQGAMLQIYALLAWAPANYANLT